MDFCERREFLSSPKVEIVSGTERVGANGTIDAQVKLLGPDGKFYLKNNSKDGFSSMTPDSWSLARAKGEVSRAFLNKTKSIKGKWEGGSGNVDFYFSPPANNMSLWRGYPIFTP